MTASGTHQWGTQPELFGPRHEHRLGLILSEVAKVRQGGRVLDAAVGLGQLATRIDQIMLSSAEVADKARFAPIAITGGVLADEAMALFAK